MNLREQELFYAALEGKHAAIDDDRDRGYFFLSINRDHGRDREFWSAFAGSYHDTMRELGKDAQRATYSGDTAYRRKARR